MAITSSVTFAAFTSTGTTAELGTSDLDLPALTWVAGFGGPPPSIPLFVASGTATSGDVGDSSLWFDHPFVATGEGHTQGDAATMGSTLTLRAFVAEGSAVTGVIGTSAADLPLFEVDGEAALIARGNSDVTLAMFLIEALASGTATAYTGLALCTSRLAQTTIDGWSFNALGALGGKLIGTTDSGLYELTGDLDGAAEIAARASTHATDFGSDRRKRVPEVLLGYRCEGDLMLVATVNEHDEHLYVVEAPGHEELSTGRVKLGKGLDGRYWQFAVENIDGCDFDLDVLSAAPLELSRRTG